MSLPWLRSVLQHQGKQYTCCEVQCALGPRAVCRLSMKPMDASICPDPAYCSLPIAFCPFTSSEACMKPLHSRMTCFFQEHCANVGEWVGSRSLGVLSGIGVVSLCAQRQRASASSSGLTTKHLFTQAGQCRKAEEGHNGLVAAQQATEAQHSNCAQSSC